MSALMQQDSLPADLKARIEELMGREKCYWEDELYSHEALTNLIYRQELEKCLKLDSLGEFQQL